MPPVLYIRLLGAPQILHGNSDLHAFPTDKVRLLFFYLLLFRNVVHTRSRLAGVFWSDSSETHARRALSTTVWRLRRWLNPIQRHSTPLLFFDDQKIAFNKASASWLDVAEFEEEVARAKQMSAQVPDQAASVFQRAVGLYRGDLIPECHADWCLVERQRLHELYLQSLWHLMVYAGGRHEYERAIGYARRILEDDPLREEVQQELMKLLVLNHQPAEALQQYQRCETVLKDELGIRPMPETQALFQQLILGSNNTSTEWRHSSARVSHDLLGQPEVFTHGIDSALRHFEVALEELTLAIEALRQTRTGNQHDSVSNKNFTSS